MTYQDVVYGNLALKEETVGTASESIVIEKEIKEVCDDYFIPLSRLFADKTARFSILKAEWEAQTAHLSSISDISMNTFYQEIIGMGKDALPLIFAELKRNPGHWFWALKSITGEDPVLPAQRGRIRQMTEAWLNWNKEKGHLFG